MDSNKLFEVIAIEFKKITNKKLFNGLKNTNNNLLCIKISQRNDELGYTYDELSYGEEGNILICSNQIKDYVKSLINGKELIILSSQYFIPTNLYGCGIIDYKRENRFKILYDYKELEQKKKYYGMWEEPDTYSFIMCYGKTYYKLNQFIFDKYRFGSLQDATTNIKQIIKNIQDANIYIDKNQYNGDNEQYYEYIELLRKSEREYRREDYYDKDYVYNFYQIEKDERNLDYVNQIKELFI